MRFLTRTLTILALIVSSFAAQAGTNLRKLIKQEQRPSMSQVIRAADQDLAFFSLGAFEFWNVRPSADRALAKFIAKLELSYPGAIYLPLGRDVVQVGDLLDAYYISQGQNGRVLRLNASGPTIHGASPASLVAFLKRSGVDLDALESSPGYVVFDYTGYADTSQSRQLIEAVYEYHIGQGRDPSILVDKFNVITVAASYGSEPRSPAARNAFIENMRTEIRESKQPPSKILAAPLLDGMTYTLEWHDSFGVLNHDFVAPPGQQFHPTVKLRIVRSMLGAFKRIKQPAFHKKVQEEALNLKFEISSRPRSCSKILKGL